MLATSSTSKVTPSMQPARVGSRYRLRRVTVWVLLCESLPSHHKRRLCDQLKGEKGCWRALEATE